MLYRRSLLAAGGLVAAGLMLSGCVATLSPAGLAALPAFEEPELSEGLARIYVLRPDLSNAHRNRVPGASLDGQVRVALHQGTYVRWDVRPGKHLVELLPGDGERDITGLQRSSLEIAAHAGQTLYVAVWTSAPSNAVQGYALPWDKSVLGELTTKQNNLPLGSSLWDPYPLYFEVVAPLDARPELVTLRQAPSMVAVPAR